MKNGEYLHERLFWLYLFVILVNLFEIGGNDKDVTKKITV